MSKGVVIKAIRYDPKIKEITYLCLDCEKEYFVEVDFSEYPVGVKCPTCGDKA